MVRKDIDNFISTLPKNISLVAATKYVGIEDIKELLKVGINNIGENRVDAFLEKYEALKDKKIIWHFIGHLQKNKAKKVVNKIDYLHSLDSLELAHIINKSRISPLKCFIEVSINLEENKNGVPYYQLEEFIKELIKLPNIELVGLMMMSEIQKEDKYSQFEKLAILKKEMEEKFQIKIPYLSMGMSNDYKEAIKAGATHIRLGRILFDL